jgi:hypothetical protein
MTDYSVVAISGLAKGSSQGSLVEFASPTTKSAYSSDAMAGLGLQIMDKIAAPPALGLPKSSIDAAKMSLERTTSVEGISSNSDLAASKANGPEDMVQRGIDSINHIYHELTKTMVAWNVVTNVSKDTKTMLQAQ